MKLWSLNLFICALLLISVHLEDVEKTEQEIANVDELTNMEKTLAETSDTSQDLQPSKPGPFLKSSPPPKNKRTERPISKKTKRKPEKPKIKNKKREQPTPKGKTTWKTGKIHLNGISIKVIYNSAVNFKGIQPLVETADKAFDSAQSEKAGKKYGGMIRKDDYIVVSQKLILWFSATKKNEGRTIQTGGGLLAGAWEITLDPKGNPSFINFDKVTYYKNLLLPGSKPKVKLPGVEAYGRYEDLDIEWGVDNANDITPGAKMGKEILSIEKGLFADEEGVFVHFKGTVTNSAKSKGIESLTDTDPRPGIEGKTLFNLVYRIPARLPEIIQEIELIVMTNNFGPISSATVSMNIPHPRKDLTYATNPEFMPENSKVNLSNVEINKHFTNSCVKEVFFYDMKSENHKGSSLKAAAAPGTGTIACVGYVTTSKPNKIRSYPKDRISYVCQYPNNDFIPLATHEEFVLEIIDDHTSKTGLKYLTLNYKLLSTPKKTLTIKKDERMILVMRYKFLDASPKIIEILQKAKPK